MTKTTDKTKDKNQDSKVSKSGSGGNGEKRSSGSNDQRGGQDKTASGRASK
jgi:hypothetical protein